MSLSSRFCMSFLCYTGNPFGNDSFRYLLNLMIKKVKVRRLTFVDKSMMI